MAKRTVEYNGSKSIMIATHHECRSRLGGAGLSKRSGFLEQLPTTPTLSSSLTVASASLSSNNNRNSGYVKRRRFLLKCLEKTKFWGASIPLCGIHWRRSHTLLLENWWRFSTGSIRISSLGCRSRWSATWIRCSAPLLVFLVAITRTFNLQFQTWYNVRLWIL